MCFRNVSSGMMLLIDGNHDDEKHDDHDVDDNGSDDSPRAAATWAR